MAEMPEVKDATFKVKVVVNKQKSKVLFALVDDSHFADVLFSFLALPLGRIVRVLKDHYGDNTPLIGSLSTLYNAVANLDSVHFDKGDLTKAMLLDPDSPFPSHFSKLKINLNKTQEPGDNSNDLENNTSYIISDDLQVMPNNMTCSVIDTLTKLGIAVTDMEETQTMLYTFGLNQIMDLLMNAFISPHPLTDIILGKREMNSAKMKSFMLHKFENINSSTNLKMAMMKVILQISTNKFLFAQTDNCFIDFLVSMLAIPLGRVELLLGRNTCLNNIDNLYRTIADYHTDIINGKDWLINPRLHRDSYTCNQLLPLPRLCYHSLRNQNFIKGPRMFMVTDDLIVTPMDLTSSLSVLNEMKISLSDVEALELHIGQKEALNILKASLTSTTALTDALELKKS